MQPLHEGTIRYLTEKGLWKDAYQVRQDELVALAAERAALFQKAMEEATAKGMTPTPEDEEWKAFWKAYKTENSGDATYGEMVMALPKG